MLRAYDLMTRSVASATPKTPVSQVASLMRDLNIGDVLVIDDGKLRGIVTDRDLAIHVLTNGATSGAPVEKFMTTDVITGAPDWSVEQLADIMGKCRRHRFPGRSGSTCTETRHGCTVAQKYFRGDTHPLSPIESAYQVR